MKGQVVKAAVATAFIFCLSATSWSQTSDGATAAPSAPTAARPFFVPEPMPASLEPSRLPTSGENSIPDPDPSAAATEAPVENSAPLVEATPQPQLQAQPLAQGPAVNKPAAPQSNPKNFYAALRQVDVEGKRAVAEGGWEVTQLQVGAQLVAQVDGRNCFLVVTSVNGNIAQLDISRCPLIDQLRVGQTLEPSLFESPKLGPPTRHERFSVLNPDEHDDRLRLAVSVYYCFGNSLDSYNLNYLQAGQSTAGSGSLTMNSAPGVAVELYQSPRSGFGWSGGVSYDFQRNVSGLNAYANGSYIGGSFNGPEPTLSLLTVYGNFIFRADDFYFPVGLNYTFPSFTGGANSFGNTNLVGGGGLQLAAGYLISDHVAAELWIQSLSLDGNTTTPYGTITYNGLNFTNTQLRFRFSF